MVLYMPFSPATNSEDHFVWNRYESRGTGKPPFTSHFRTRRIRKSGSSAMGKRSFTSNLLSSRVSAAGRTTASNTSTTAELSHNYIKWGRIKFESYAPGGEDLRRDDPQPPPRQYDDRWCNVKDQGTTTNNSAGNKQTSDRDGEHPTNR